MDSYYLPDVFELTYVQGRTLYATYCKPLQRNIKPGTNSEMTLQQPHQQSGLYEDPILAFAPPPMPKSSHTPHRIKRSPHQIWHGAHPQRRTAKSQHTCAQICPMLSGNIYRTSYVSRHIATKSRTRGRGRRAACMYKSFSKPKHR